MNFCINCGHSLQANKLFFIFLQFIDRNETVVIVYMRINNFLYFFNSLIEMNTESVLVKENGQEKEVGN